MLVNKIKNNKYNQPHNKIIQLLHYIKSPIQLSYSTIVQRKKIICNFLYYFFYLLLRLL